ncbi:CidA/LrgA family protein [Kordiimonas pumila]|uniref:CidA/LrgA family protein n=1 Tax=Kordiimonas pumila TaxID=2161677 RepID=A0ABV7D3L9_9PROT|nr:CidA/LrgA family protein [Kordiimonas pumila]
MKAIGGIIIFIVLVGFASWVIELSSVPVMPSIAVMVGLLVFLRIYGRVPALLDAGANSLFRLFPLLFIPPVVMVVAVKDLLLTNMAALLFAVTASCLLGLATSAFIYRLFARRQKGKVVK